MRLNLYGLLALTFLPLSLIGQKLQSPEAYLPTNYGEHFTPHYLKVDYFEYVAANSDRVQLMEYGRTHEDRPLLMAFVSTPENLRQLEQIRLANLARTGKIEGDPDAVGDTPIVWLSYGVHGNEAGASESSLNVLYQLANTDNAETSGWLENTVVIIDPCLNPDGNARYTNWYRSIAGEEPDPDRHSREHHEPWPGGRVNHYYFDLNRDWAWATQIETQQRLEQYQRWMPHIHVDAHEQYPNDPYYFAPAAHPYHKAITQFQADFQHFIGENNAKSFDAEGWLYFTREIFDLFYPSYGDTYPTFNGSIGMTYEQAGHGISGRGIEMDNGDTLTLRDRIDHHSVATLTTVSTAANNSGELIQAFAEYFKEANSGTGLAYKSFVISSDNSKDRLEALTDLLDLHDIRYEAAASDGSAQGFDYTSGVDGNIDIQEGDLVIRTNQPQGKLAHVLFEPAPFLEDSLTYDITSWALPFAYGLKAGALNSVPATRDYAAPAKMVNPSIDPSGERYAYLVRWESMQDAHFLSEALKAGLKIRVAKAEMETASGSFGTGTLVITRADNRKVSDWEGILLKVAAETGQHIEFVNTGFAIKGPDLGSSALGFVDAPRIMLAWGDRMDNNAMGATWHYFDQVVDYPVTITKDSRINANSLDDYDLLVIPNGRLSFDESQWEDLTEWTRGGGRVVVLGGAAGNFRNRDGFGLSAKESPQEQDLESDPMSYGGRERSFIPQSVPGAIFQTRLDPTHPISFGLGEDYYSLKVSGAAYDFMSGGSTVSWIDSDAASFGFAGWKARKRLEKSLVVGHRPMGRGSIVYLIDDPLFRGFWYEGLLLMSNAVFFSGS
ncbi:MAG: zinc carboxypeptidase [Bacteroidetes bacterium]|nr:zinc carboxypeptidase [Bacteroidota bacterium]